MRHLKSNKKQNTYSENILFRKSILIFLCYHFQYIPRKTESRIIIAGRHDSCSNIICTILKHTLPKLCQPITVTITLCLITQILLYFVMKLRILFWNCNICFLTVICSLQKIVRIRSIEKAAQNLSFMDCNLVSFYSDMHKSIIRLKII